MQAINVFPDVPLSEKVKFKTQQKVLIKTPRVLKQFKIEQARKMALEHLEVKE